LKRLFLALVFLVIMSGNALAAVSTTIEKEDVAGVSAMIMKIITIRYPTFSLVQSTSNSLIFRYIDTNPLVGNAEHVINFTFVENSQGKVVLNMDGTTHVSDGFLVGDLMTKIEDKELSKVVFLVKTACDGRYVYGFDGKKKVDSVVVGGAFSRAGIVKGDRIVKIDGEKVTDVSLAMIGEKEFTTFTIKHDGKEKDVIVAGEYISPDKVQIEYGI